MMPKRMILLALALVPCLSHAAWTLRYDGPDVVTLMSRPNAAASNARSAHMERRDLAKQALALMLAPAFEGAFASCDLADIDEVLVTPANIPDRLGDTLTHIQGLGMYVSLPLADRVSSGTWFIAPFITIQVQLMKGGHAVDSSDSIFLSTLWHVSREQEMNDDQFFRIKTDAVEESLFKFAKEQMPAAMKGAFPKRCK
jgi:hypothetical protein